MERKDQITKKIKEKRYVGALSGYTGKILLVGVNYDSTGSDKKHDETSATKSLPFVFGNVLYFVP